MTIQPREYCGAITVDASKWEKQYGIVNRLGKRHFRNYKRNVRGGFSLLDMIIWRMWFAKSNLRAILDESLYGEH